MSDQLVYLVRRIGTNEYKIGRSRNPIGRVRSLATAGTLDLLHVTASDGNKPHLENRLHEQFKHCCLGGEWFALTEEDVAEILKLPYTKPPSAIEGRGKAVIYACLPRELADRLAKAIAGPPRISVSSWIEMAIEEALTRRGL